MASINYKLRFCFLMRGMFTTEPAIFFKVQFIRGVSLVFGCRIVFTLAVTAGEKNDFPHGLLPLSL